MQILILKPWRWVHRVPMVMVHEMRQMSQRFWLSRKILFSVTRVEFAKKYAGSILGMLWFPLYTALLLGMYCFIFMVVFPYRYHDFGTYEKVLFIFAGLIPYLGFSEALGSSTSSIKGNITLVKNAVFPAEFIPVKHMLVALGGMGISLAIFIAMLLPTKFVGWHWFYAPVPLLMLLTLCLGSCWLFSALAVILPDLNYLINLILLFCMFLAPIGFTPEELEGTPRFLPYLNPLTYPIDAFRYTFLGIRSLPLWADAAYLVVAVFSACAAGTFFRRLTPVFADYE